MKLKKKKLAITCVIRILQYIILKVKRIKKDIATKKKLTICHSN